jgi:tetratricopeptide (TPR) repeat protein
MANPFSKAVRKLKRWYSSAPGPRELRLLADQGDWAALEEKGRLVLGNEPNQPVALTMVAYSLQQQGRLEEALTFALRAVAGSPTQGHPYFIAGFALKGMGREAEACPHLREAVALEPDNVGNLRYLVEAVAASHGIAAAADEFTRHCHRIGRPVEIKVAPISSVRDWARKAGHALLEAGEIEEIPFEAPCVWGAPVPSERYHASSNKPYVAEIADARIFSHSGLVLTADGTALSDVGGHLRFGRYVSFAYEKLVLARADRDLLLDLDGYETRTIDGGVHLAGSASGFFGHWLPEFLPRLEYFRSHPDFAGLPIIVDADMPQSHFELLRRYVDNPLILLRDGESLVCRRLLVSPPPAFSPVELLPNDIPVHEMPGLSPRALRFLRSGFDDACRGPRTGRFFLSRRRMKWRRLLNEAEIAAELSGIGFEEVFLEDLDIGAQVDIFQRAEWIVAPNGSSLLNLIFAHPDVKLLVLSQPGLFNWGTYQGPMRSLGYHPVWLCGENAAAGMGKHADYAVPVGRVLQVLAGMGLPEAAR